MSLRDFPERLLQDLRFALRLARTNAVFTAVVLATLALGIGASTAMFAIIDTVLIQPLPYDHAEQLVSVHSAVGGYMSAPDMLDFRDRNSVFSSMAIWNRGVAVLSGAIDPEHVSTMEVSTGFFATVGVHPLLGRTFLPDEENRTSSVVVLSHGLWLKQFAANASIVGSTVTLDGKPAEIIGVVPAVLDQNLDAQLFRPFDFHAPHATVRAYHTQPVVARLKQGVSLRAAEADLSRIARELNAAYPDEVVRTIALQPYLDTIIGGARSQLIYLLVAVMVVLLIACGNVASLMLSRATTRQHELATRVAIGASRARLLQQLLTESLTLAVAGGLLGLGLAWVALGSLRVHGAGILPRAAEIHIDSVAAFFTIATSIVTGLLVGVGSAVRASGQAARPRLNVGSSRFHSRGNSKMRQVVVVVQLASSLVLVASAAELLDSYWKLAHADAGFQADGLLTAKIDLPSSRYDPAGAHQFWTELLQEVRTLPHVVAASAAAKLPLDQYPGGAHYLPAGAPQTLQTFAPSATPGRIAQFDAVADHYFEAMRIPLLAGRAFGGESSKGEAPVVLVSQSIARRYPLGILGMQFTFPDYEYTARVIGVVGDVRSVLPGSPPAEIVYLPTAQADGGWEKTMSLVVRTDRDPLALAGAVRGALRRRDPALALGEIRPMVDVLGRPLARQRLETTLLVGFGAAALLLAALGLYGLLAYGVSTRAHEFAIRFALGARGDQLFLSVVRNGMTLVAIGLGAGVFLLPSTTRVLRRVFAIESVGPGMVLLIGGVLCAVGVCACVIPALQATRLGSAWMPVE